MAKGNLKKVNGTSRTDSFRVNPTEIIVDWSSNPREDYGGDDFQELKNSIEKEGVIMPLMVYIDKDTNKLHLAHGFRRMKAILELIDEGKEIEVVPIKQIENNIEKILEYHLTLNNGKPLSDIEIAVTLKQLFKYVGEDYNLVAKKANMSYQKVYNLINYIESSSTLSQEMVRKQTLSLANAMAIANQAKNIDQQNEILKNAENKATSEGRKKIKPKDLTGIKTQNYNPFKKFVSYVEDLKANNVESISLADLSEVLERLEKREPLVEVAS